MILTGDCRDILPTLEDESVDCIVTSPPYFRLREYGVVGEIGIIGRQYRIMEYLEQLGVNTT